MSSFRTNNLNLGQVILLRDYLTFLKFTGNPPQKWFAQVLPYLSRSNQSAIVIAGNTTGEVIDSALDKAEDIQKSLDKDALVKESENYGIQNRVRRVLSVPPDNSSLVPSTELVEPGMVPVWSKAVDLWIDSRPAPSRPFYRRLHGAVVHYMGEYFPADTFSFAAAVYRAVTGEELTPSVVSAAAQVVGDELVHDGTELLNQTLNEVESSLTGNNPYFITAEQLERKELVGKVNNSLATSTGTAVAVDNNPPLVDERFILEYSAKNAAEIAQAPEDIPVVKRIFYNFGMAHLMIATGHEFQRSSRDGGNFDQSNVDEETASKLLTAAEPGRPLDSLDELFVNVYVAAASGLGMMVGGPLGAVTGGVISMLALDS